MDRKISIPVKIVRPDDHGAAQAASEDEILQNQHHGLSKRPMDEPRTKIESESIPAAVEPAAESTPQANSEAEEWRERALRLQAEMDNYRKRQQRLAQDRIDAERQRLLNAFLGVVDNLERALEAPATGIEGLRQGVELTHREALQLLQREGVERIQANGQAFDPNWHEAVTTVGRNGSDIGPNMVVRVLEPGYRLEDHLLRPAKVAVAI
jgi:molecular chaperone GrpE